MQNFTRVQKIIFDSEKAFYIGSDQNNISKGNTDKDDPDMNVFFISIDSPLEHTTSYFLREDASQSYMTKALSLLLSVLSVKTECQKCNKPLGPFSIYGSREDIHSFS